MLQPDGCKYTYEIIAQMLKGYSELKRKARQLEFEIDNYIPIATGEEMIEAMTFNKSSEDCVNVEHKGRISDKTANIALVYTEKTRNVNIKHIHELEEDLRATNMSLLRIEYYIGILNEKHSVVLRMLYIEELTYAAAAEKAGISITFLKQLRKAGINRLVEMYNAIIL